MYNKPDIDVNFKVTLQECLSRRKVIWRLHCTNSTASGNVDVTQRCSVQHPCRPEMKYLPYSGYPLDLSCLGGLRLGKICVFVGGHVGSELKRVLRWMLFPESTVCLELGLDCGTHCTCSPFASCDGALFFLSRMLRVLVSVLTKLITRFRLSLSTRRILV